MSASHENSILQEAVKALRRYWGYESFRPGQRKAIESVLSEKDVLLLMPTGGGKSICYQVPAIVRKGFGLVISPLIALMQDQVESLSQRGISAAFINSTLSYREIEQRWINAEHGMYELVYMAPERLSSDLFKARKSRLNINLIAIDEAHCVSEWGHHFRPAYLQIADSFSDEKRPPFIAVTATATPEVRRDIIKQLNLDGAEKIVRGFDRPNLVWSVFSEVNKKRKLREIVDNVTGTGIVYVATRKSAKRWAAWLRKQDIRAEPYHGGMQVERRAKVQHKWLQGKIRMVVATNAFGMGIDKEDVRVVVHVELPASLEAYYQEAGRGGRDGKTAYAVLLYQQPDAETQQYLIDSGHPTREDVVAVYRAVCNLAQIPVNATPEDPIIVDLPAVCRLTDLSQPLVQNAIRLLEQHGFWEVMPRRSDIGHIRFVQGTEDVRAYAYSQQNQALRRFIQGLLRAVHADAFSGWWPLHLKSISRKMGLSEDRLESGLKYLATREILDWMGSGEVLRLLMIEPRTERPRVDDSAVKRARKQAEKRLSYLMQYAQSTTCRRKFLLNYFGESCPDTCGKCDVCLGRHDHVEITPDDASHLRRVLRSASDHEERSKWELDFSSHRLDSYLDYLVQRGYLQPVAGVNISYRVTQKGMKLVEKGEG